jgi:hypothetical protein
VSLPISEAKQKGANSQSRLTWSNKHPTDVGRHVSAGGPWPSCQITVSSLPRRPGRKAFSRVGMPSGQRHPHAGRDSNHLPRSPRATAAMAADSVAASTRPVTRSRPHLRTRSRPCRVVPPSPPVRHNDRRMLNFASRGTAPMAVPAAGVGKDAAGSDECRAGERLRPRVSATRLSSTIRCFSAEVQPRRRFRFGKTVTVAYVPGHLQISGQNNLTS